ncbi:phosphoglycolate phosphatase, bacterial [Rhodobacteraceae bacterium EhC02]|nr:phosphoglycolate phosphatase, bacterial [Rhodobacteraceae bacterium EhC02]
MSGLCNDLKAVIFDLDGTLIDSAPDIAAGVNKYLSDNGWPTLDVATIEAFIGHGPRRLILDVFAHIGHPDDDASVDRAHQAYLANYRESPAARTVFFPDVRADLELLAKSGLRLGICTNKPDEMTGRVLAALGIAHLFEAAIGADAVPDCKPHPGHLQAVAARMGLANGDYIYVGDTVVDQATAQAAGVPFYVVPWGGGRDVVVAPGHRLNGLSELVKLAQHAAKKDQV